MESFNSIFLFVILCFVFSCTKQATNLQYEIINGEYIVLLPSNRYNFRVDSSRVYIGEESQIYLYSEATKIGLEIIIGHNNPSPYYWRVLNFQDSNPEDQFLKFEERNFIYSTQYKGELGKIKSIYYLEDDELEKIESNSVTIDSLILNARMIRNIDFIKDKKLTDINKYILKRIKVMQK